MKMTIGIDEVGRGPIAGPLCVCAFMTNHTKVQLKFKVESLKLKIKLPLRDSKKLSKKQREAWFLQIEKWKKEGKCNFAISYVEAKTIDKIGLTSSINRALSRALYNLKPKTSNLILLDGGLKAPKEFLYQKTIIKGDEKEPIIALASIVAKVSRDRLMYHHAKKFPNYGFENHVGYGTKAHYAAIKNYGITPLHRRSFLKKYTEIS